MHKLCRPLTQHGIYRYTGKLHMQRSSIELHFLHQRAMLSGHQCGVEACTEPLVAYDHNKRAARYAAALQHEGNTRHRDTPTASADEPYPSITYGMPYCAQMLRSLSLFQLPDAVSQHPMHRWGVQPSACTHKNSIQRPTYHNIPRTAPKRHMPSFRTLSTSSRPSAGHPGFRSVPNFTSSVSDTVSDTPKLCVKVLCPPLH